MKTKNKSGTKRRTKITKQNKYRGTDITEKRAFLTFSVSLSLPLDPLCSPFAFFSRLFSSAPSKLLSVCAGRNEVEIVRFVLRVAHILDAAEKMTVRVQEVGRWTINGCIFHSHNRKKTHKTPMELNVEGFDGKTYVVGVDVDDTAKDLRRKVATAAGFAEDSFHIHTQGFGGNDEGEDINITALSAGDTVFTTQTKKQEAIAALHALDETDLTPERLASVENPKVVQLFLQAEVVAETPNRLLAGSAALSSLDLSAPLVIAAIGDRFLLECSSLKSVDLSGLSNVTRIGEEFLGGCGALETIDFAGLRSVKSLGEGFLSDCTSLTSIDFAGLSNVTSLGNDFLQRCRSLTTIDFAGLSSVTSLGERFLSDCTSLTLIEFAGLRNSLVCICTGFLQNCSSLTVLDLSSLNSLAHVGDYFLRNCSSLTALNLSSLHNLKHIGRYFLHKCTGLRELDLSSLISVTRVGHAFCQETSLQTIRLSGCSAVSRAVEEADLSELVVEL